MSEQPTGEVIATASAQTPIEGTSAPELDEAALKAHPLYQEMERQKNAAEQKASSAEGRLKKVAKSASEDDDDSNKTNQTNEVDSELDWKIDNNSRVKLVKDEYASELAILKSAGAKETNEIRTIALERAEQKKGIIADTSDIERQAAMSSAPGTISRMKSNPVELTEYDKRFGITAERKRELQEKYPGLKEDVF